MSRIYAVEEGTSRRFLARIECDASGCEASIKPNPEIATSGWVKCGLVLNALREAYRRTLLLP